MGSHRETWGDWGAMGRQRVPGRHRETGESQGDWGDTGSHRETRE